MKILFLENRRRTYVWQCWAKFLRANGHETAFLVYNHSFSPKGETNFVIPYPKKSDLMPYPEDKKDESYRKVKSSDRMINHFGKNDYHYAYYRHEIEEIVDYFQPDLVFGECTQFYELFTVYACKNRGILYLVPNTCRYPVHRYSFYKYDTLEPYMGSGEKMDDEDAMKVINSIIKRNIKPEYMVKPHKTLAMRWFYYCYEAKVTWSHYMGAKYIIPSFKDKMNRDHKLKEQCRRWDEIAQKKSPIANGKFVIMYPMHMQPEANLDVWGNEHMNQLETIKELVDKTDENTVILVKPNPKAKYELSDEMLDYIEQTDKVHTCILSYPMQECLKITDLVVTVTGTIAIECILMNKPVVTLHKTLNNDQKNCPFMEKFEQVGAFVEQVTNNTFPTLTDKEKIEYINVLNSTSYYGAPSLSDYKNDFTGVEQCLDDLLKVVNGTEQTLKNKA